MSSQICWKYTNQLSGQLMGREWLADKSGAKYRVPGNHYTLQAMIKTMTTIPCPVNRNVFSLSLSGIPGDTYNIDWTHYIRGSALDFDASVVPGIPIEQCTSAECLKLEFRGHSTDAQCRRLGKRKFLSATATLCKSKQPYVPAREIYPVGSAIATLSKKRAKASIAVFIATNRYMMAVSRIMWSCGVGDKGVRIVCPYHVTAPSSDKATLSVAFQRDQPWYRYRCWIQDCPATCSGNRLNAASGSMPLVDEKLIEAVKRELERRNIVVPNIPAFT